VSPCVERVECEMTWEDELRKQIRTEIRQRVRKQESEKIAKNLLDGLDDEKISNYLGMEISKVKKFRRDYEKRLYVEKLIVKEYGQSLTDEMISKSVPTQMFLINGQMEGIEHLLLMSLFAIGWSKFWEIL
jgi:hypothetical protein